MSPSLVRFSRGYLGGILVWTVFPAVGLIGWGIAAIIGVDNYGSIEEISLLPFYVLSFGFGGGVVKMFEADKTKSVKSFLAWVFAFLIVLSGCFFIASFVGSEGSIDQVLVVNSAAVLFATLASAFVITTLNKRIEQILAEAPD
jgi:hypothetical protein